MTRHKLRNVQTQLIIPPILRDRADILALIRNQPRAEIWRLALEGDGIKGLEKWHREELEDFRQIARRLHAPTPGELAAYMIRGGFTLADARTWTTYPGPDVQ